MKKLKLKLNTKFFRFYFLDLAWRQTGFILSRKANGFTLIEILVALGVFMVVMTITLSAFLNIIDIQKKTEAFRKVNDNLNFAMEAMMRDIREGKDYSASGESFSFTSGATGPTVTYSLNKDNASDQFIERKEGINKPLRMTSDGIKISKVSFSARGNAAGDKTQPLVTISISGESGEKFKSSLNLQATVSQRKLDPL